MSFKIVSTNKVTHRKQVIAVDFSPIVKLKKAVFLKNERNRQ